MYMKSRFENSAEWRELHHSDSFHTKFFFCVFFFRCLSLFSLHLFIYAIPLYIPSSSITLFRIMLMQVQSTTFKIKNSCINFLLWLWTLPQLQNFVHTNTHNVSSSSLIFAIFYFNYLQLRSSKVHHIHTYW